MARHGIGIVWQLRRVTYGLLNIIFCAAVNPQHPQRHDISLPGHSGHADAVIGIGADGTGHVSAVKTAGAHPPAVTGIFRIGIYTVAVARTSGVTNKIIAIHQAAGIDIRVIGQNPRINYCHRNTRAAGGGIPGLR